MSVMLLLNVFARIEQITVWTCSGFMWPLSCMWKWFYWKINHDSMHLLNFSCLAFLANFQPSSNCKKCWHSTTLVYENIQREQIHLQLFEVLNLSHIVRMLWSNRSNSTSWENLLSLNDLKHFTDQKNTGSWKAEILPLSCCFDLSFPRLTCL